MVNYAKCIFVQTVPSYKRLRSYSKKSRSYCQRMYLI